MLLLLAACAPSDAEESPPSAAGCDRSVPSQELAGEARIRWDDLGVPHVYAASDADLFFASGWLQGAMRLGEIQYNRRAATGSLAAKWGEDAVGSDLVARAFDFEGLACASLAQMREDRPEDSALADAFVAGLNRAQEEIAAGTLPAPAGWEADAAPFSTLDVLTMGKRVSLGYSNQLDFDLLNTLSEALLVDYPDVPIYQPAVAAFVTADSPLGPPVRCGVEVGEVGERLRALAELHTPDRASNNWVVSGEYTADGRPLLANDPHSRLQDPARLLTWHLNSKDGGGNFDVVGFAFPGVPGVQLGHNDRLAWAATTAFADAIDLYDVPVEDDVALLHGEERAVSWEEVELDVAGELRSYRLGRIDGVGPFLPDEVLPIDKEVLADGEILVRWVGFEVVDTSLFQYLDLDRAEDLDDFRGAIDHERFGMQNWIGATEAGWAYKTHGDLPVRAGGNPAKVMDGSDPAQAWTGEWVDASLLPQVDGDRPWLTSANNDPLGVTADNDALNDSFYYGSWFDPGFRANRIGERLEELTGRGGVRLEEMMELQLDVHNELADQMIPRLVAAAARIDEDEELADWRGRSDLVEATARLEAWDRAMAVDSTEAALGRTWIAFLQYRVLQSDFSLLFEEIENASPVTMDKLLLRAYDDDNTALLDGDGQDELLRALDDALAWLGERGDPSWGELHVHQVDSIFGEDRTLTTPGDETSVNVAKGGWFQDNSLSEQNVAWEGALFRQVTRFGDDGVPELWFNVVASEAGSDEAWVAGDYAYLPFRSAEVEAATVREDVLSP